MYTTEKTDICNFADDNTIYACAKTLQEIINNLEHDLSKILTWFSQNLLAANPSKFQMLILGESNLPVELTVKDIKIVSSSTVKLLGITIDHKLTFLSHIKSLCTKATNRVRNLYRIQKYLNRGQLILLLNSFIVSTFSYAPILWMFYGKVSHKEIEKIHKRALRAVTKDFSSSYHELLYKSACRLCCFRRAIARAHLDTHLN